MKQDSRIVPMSETPPQTTQQSISIHRPCFTRSRFDVNNSFHHPPTTIKDRAGKFSRSLCPKNCKAWQRRLLSLFPFIGIMRNYGKSDLVSDLIAGLTVGIMHIPQGMAYGFLANIDPVYGLYTSFFSIFVYFFFGTSRHISLGVFAVVSLMVGNVVDKADCTTTPPPTAPPSNNTAFISNISSVLNASQPASDPHLSHHDAVELCRVQHALAATFLVGVFQLLMGLCHLGFTTNYLSEPLTRAFTTGAAIHVFSSQVKHALGVSPEKFHGPFKLVFLYWSLAQNVVNVNWPTFLMCFVCMAIIFCVQQYVAPILKKFTKVPIPSELIVMVIGTLITHYCHLSDTQVANIKVLGDIPQGIPPPQMINFRLLPSLVLDAIAISIVTFTVNISMASMFSSKHQYHLDSNQELIAYGMTNAVTSFFNCYVSAASLSRTLVQEATGGKTQIAGLVASLLLLIVLLFVGPLFYHLPNCILAAVIIVNLKGIFMQVLDLKYLSSISLFDASVWVVTCLSVVLLDVDLGLLVGLAFSFLTVVVRSQVLKLQELGNIEGTELYVEVKDYKHSKVLPGVLVFKANSSIFYANSQAFVDAIKSSFNNNDAHNKLASCRDVGAADCNAKDTNNNKNHNSNQNNNNNSNNNQINSINNTNSDDSANNEVNNNMSASLLDDLVSAHTGTNQPGVSRTTHVIIDMSQVAFIDVVAISALQSTLLFLKAKNIQLSLSSCNHKVYKMLRAATEMKKLNKMSIYVSTHDAVLSAQ